MVRRRIKGGLVLASLLAGSLVNVLAAPAEVEDFSIASGDAARLARVRTRAEAGQVRAQSALGDYYLAASDPTNAVVWYRKAAAQGAVEAQLALASFCLAGQGTDRNPVEAARLLRAAAARIEETAAGEKSAPPVDPVAPRAAKAAAGAPPTRSDGFRIQRVLTVHAREPQKLDIAPPLQLQRATP